MVHSGHLVQKSLMFGKMVNDIGHQQGQKYRLVCIKLDCIRKTLLRCLPSHSGQLTCNSAWNEIRMKQQVVD